jgi:hypothetical protein
MIEEATHDLVMRLAHKLPPEPIPLPVPKPVQRYWPVQPGQGLLTGAQLHFRQPDCTFAFHEVKPRKIARSPRSHMRGRQCRLPSMKMQRQMRANSGLEFEHLRDCELDSGVIKFVEQPIRLTYLLAGRKARHECDALLLTVAGLECREVKYEADAASSENEARWPEIGLAFNSFGVSFRVVTELHIREATRLANVNAIWENRMSPIPSEADRYAIAEALRAGAAMSICEVQSVFSLQFRTILALVRRGFLAVDLDHPIQPHSEIRLGAGLRFAAGTRVLRR